MKKKTILLVVLSIVVSACTQPVVDTFGNIGGTVSDASTNNPLSGVSVVLTPTGYSQVTNNKGVFQFDNLDVQEYTLSFSLPGYEPYQHKVSVKPGLSSSVQISLKEIGLTTGSISGKVVDASAGTALNGVTVSLTPSGKSLVTGDDGAVLFSELEPRDYTLNFSRSGYEPYQHSATVKAGQVTDVQVSLKLMELTKAVLSMGSITNLTSNSVLVHATLSSTGNSAVTQHGFCLSEHENATISDRCFNLGTATAATSFSQNITDLSPSTTYYCRAFAQNSAGLVYSEESVFATPSSEDEESGVAVPGGLILYYSFDEESAKDWTDFHFDGSLVEEPAFIDDTPQGKGKAIFINGTKNQYINIPYNIFNGLQNYTISFWVKDFSVGSVISGIGDYSYNIFCYPGVFFLNTGTIEFRCGMLERFESPKDFPAYNYSSIQSGAWHQITVICEKDNQKLYVDGVLKDTKTSRWDNTGNDAPKLQIGGNINGLASAHFSGKLDNIRIYNRAISSDEVATLYNAEK